MPTIVVPAKPKPVEVPLTLRGASALIRKHRKKGDESDEVLNLMERTAADLSAAAQQIPISFELIMNNQMQSPLLNAASASTHQWDFPSLVV